MRPRRIALLVLAFALLGAACAQQEQTPGATAAADECSAKVRAAAVGFAPIEASSSSKAARVLAQAKKTVRIGFLGDVTGKNSSLVVHPRNAALLAIEQANAKGDLPVKLELSVQDNKDGGEATAPPLAQKLIGDASVVGVIGPGFSGETKTTGKLFESAGLTHISQSATNPELTKNGWKTFFRALANDSVQGGQTGDLIVKVLNCKNVAVVNDKSEYGTGIGEAVRDSVTKAGGTVVLDEGIEPTTDYTSVVDSLLQKKPDAVYYAGYSPETSLLVKQYRQKGGTAVFVSGDGSKTARFLQEGAPDNADAILTCPCLDPTASTDQAAKTFVADYKAKFKEDPGVYSSEGWDAAQMFIAAVKAAGADVTRAKVLDYVTNIKDFKGLSKTFNWTPEHEVVEGEITYVYRVKGSAYELLGRIDELVKNK